MAKVGESQEWLLTWKQPNLCDLWVHTAGSQPRLYCPFRSSVVNEPWPNGVKQEGQMTPEGRP